MATMPEYVKAGIALRSAEAEERIRKIIREEIAAYFASVSTSGAGPHFTVNIAPESDPETLARRVERVIRASIQGGGSYREYLATRDEPPAAPPVRVINTTERL